MLVDLPEPHPGLALAYPVWAEFLHGSLPERNPATAAFGCRILEGEAVGGFLP